MRRLRSGLLLFASLLVCSSLWARQVQRTGPTLAVSASSDSRAVALMQQSLAALTGRALVSDVTLTANARRIAGSDDEAGTATLKAMAGGDSRMDLNLPSGVRSEIRNPAGTPLPDSLPLGLPAGVAQGTQPVGAWSGPDGIAHGMASHNTFTDATWFLPALTVAALVSSQNYAFTYAGEETRDGQTVLHLTVSQQFLQFQTQDAALLQRLSQMDLYLDPTTLLPVALAFNTHPDNNALINIPTEIRFSDYRAVNGIQVPFHVQRYLNNSLVLDLAFESVTFNTGLAATSFAIQ